MTNGQEKLNKRISQFVQVREKIREMKQEIKPYQDLKDALEGNILVILAQMDLKSVKTGEATAYTSTRWSAAVEDKEAFMDYVKESQEWELLDVKANVTSTKAFEKANKVLPPGVKLTGNLILGVRVAGQKEEDHG